MEAVFEFGTITPPPHPKWICYDLYCMKDYCFQGETDIPQTKMTYRISLRKVKKKSYI